MLTCFNWATSFQTWKWNAMSQNAHGAIAFQLGHVFSDMERNRHRKRWGACHLSFNWATSFQTWICIDHSSRSFQHLKFQLGHVFSDMDTSGRFSAFTAIEKKPIFAHTVNFDEYFQKVGLCSKRFSICNGFSRISQGFGHHIDVRNLHRNIDKNSYIFAHPSGANGPMQ